mmetsp:Transcript_95341/g.264969  ORF Transcript_95341/g.264969 Transcript_95341/m.264969 type:complete len:254 (-) Transcript_95341:626-1387(-)
MGLVRGVFLSLILQPFDHVSDEALDLGKGIRTSPHARLRRRCHACGKLRELRGVLLAREVPDEAHGLVVREVRARGELHESHLVEAVRECVRTGRILFDGLLSRRKGLELFSAGLGLGFEVLRLRHASLVEVRKRRDVLLKLARSDLEITLGGRLLLAARCVALLCLGHFLGGVFDLILQRQLEHLKIVKVCGLRLACICQLTLGLLQKVLQCADDPSALSLVNSRIGGPEARVPLLRLLGTLDQCCELLRIS